MSEGELAQLVSSHEERLSLVERELKDARWRLGIPGPVEELKKIQDSLIQYTVGTLLLTTGELEVWVEANKFVVAEGLTWSHFLTKTVRIYLEKAGAGS